MIKKIILSLIAVGAIAIVAVWHGALEQQRMDEYAIANNCSWSYDYYMTEQPICK
jgi:hypothetical protein